MAERPSEEKNILQLPLDQSLARAIYIIVSRNYFYLISAALMLFGCYKLMYSPLIEGTHFFKTLISLSVLQAYEVLVIGTALVIVVRFKELNDAWLLLIAELIILFDPTFFSNHFGNMTVPSGEVLHGVATREPLVAARIVNVVCFVLVGVKLLILRQGLRLYISWRTLGAMMVAAASIYLCAGPLMEDEPLGLFSRTGYYYLLAWIPLIYAFLLPPIEKTVHVRDKVGDEDGFISLRRLVSLRRFLVAIPLIVLLLHLWETGQVHYLNLYPAYFSPLFLALGFIVAKNCKEFNWIRMIVIDFLCVVALLLSVDSINTIRENAAGNVLQWPLWMASGGPLYMTGAGVVLLYGWIFVFKKYKAALWHIVFLGLGASAYMFFTMDSVVAFLENASDAIMDGLLAIKKTLARILSQFGKFLVNYPIAPFGFCAVLSGIAFGIWRYKFLLWGFFTFLVLALFDLFPGTYQNLAPELIYCLLLVIVGMEHYKELRKESHDLRKFILFFTVGIALIRTLGSANWVGWSIFLTTGILLILIGIWCKIGYYIFYGIIQVSILAVLGFLFADIYKHTGLIMIAMALLFFGGGIAITFFKSRVMTFMDQLQDKKEGNRALSSNETQTEIPDETDKNEETENNAPTERTSDTD
ncbi:MAG: hypothetical protein ACLFUS_02995 [Candidatus Sumerlaeia bacterium]